MFVTGGLARASARRRLINDAVLATRNESGNDGSLTKLVQEGLFWGKAMPWFMATTPQSPASTWQ
jgi:hypothetical protein